MNHESTPKLSIPANLIAKYPCRPRDSAKLLHVDKNLNITDKSISDIPFIINSNDIVIYNDCLVIKARIFAAKINLKKKKINIEIFLLSKDSNLEWKALLKPLKRLKIGDILFLGTDCEIEIIKIYEGQAIIKFHLISKLSFDEILNKFGNVPIPPYLERHSTKKDEKDYQTVFAKIPGAVAAPTAGLHFSKQLINKLINQGIKLYPITLLVSGGTFLQPTEQQIRDGILHSEKYFIPSKTWSAVKTAKANNNKIIAIGTTSLRALESSDNKNFSPNKWCETNIYIRNNYSFKFVDILMTNFHLPESSLLELVKSFIGKELTISAYKYAIKKLYRFYSFGDACWFEKKHRT